MYVFKKPLPVKVEKPYKVPSTVKAYHGLLRGEVVPRSVAPAGNSTRPPSNEAPAPKPGRAVWHYWTALCSWAIAAFWYMRAYEFYQMKVPNPPTSVEVIRGANGLLFPEHFEVNMWAGTIFLGIGLVALIIGGVKGWAERNFGGRGGSELAKDPPEDAHVEASQEKPEAASPPTVRCPSCGASVYATQGSCEVCSATIPRPAIQPAGDTSGAGAGTWHLILDRRAAEGRREDLLTALRETIFDPAVQAVNEREVKIASGATLQQVNALMGHLHGLGVISRKQRD